MLPSLVVIHRLLIDRTPPGRSRKEHHDERPRRHRDHRLHPAKRLPRRGLHLQGRAIVSTRRACSSPVSPRPAARQPTGRSRPIRTGSFRSGPTLIMPTSMPLPESSTRPQMVRNRPLPPRDDAHPPPGVVSIASLAVARRSMLPTATTTNSYRVCPRHSDRSQLYAETAPAGACLPRCPRGLTVEKRKW